MGPEPSPLLRRIRWGNVARAGAAVALLALVAAWPRLGPHAPGLPPTAVQAATTPESSSGEFGVEAPVRRPARHRRRARHVVRRHRRRTRAPRAQIAARSRAR